jgi:hypothetical protein
MRGEIELKVACKVCDQIVLQVCVAWHIFCVASLCKFAFGVSNPNS